MLICITGGNGFIGRNLQLRLSDCEDIKYRIVTRSTSSEQIEDSILAADAIVHLAAANRPLNNEDFTTVNVELTKNICSLLARNGKKTAIIYASSVQAGSKTTYGKSKRRAEQILLNHSKRTSAKVAYLRLPNVFGKWARPNYNSVIATFCHNIARNIPISVHDEDRRIKLVHVDSVVHKICDLLKKGIPKTGEYHVAPVYSTTVGHIEKLVKKFSQLEQSINSGPVGKGFTRALYSTYLTYMPPEKFIFPIVRHSDTRGTFTEFFKSYTSGQISILTAYPGTTRGGHYHNIKSEKFLVVSGLAEFSLRNVDTGEKRTFLVSDADASVVITVPGWEHCIKNIGSELLVVLVWANEVFDKNNTDTITR